MKPTDVPHFAQHLLEKHGLWQQGWRFAWDRAKRRAGCCKYRKRLITLSQPYVELNTSSNPDDIIDTILHEIAHALVGHGHGHDAVWQMKAEEIGARPVRCCDAAAIVLPRGEYVAKCGGCGKEFRRHKAVKYRYCLACGPGVGKLNFVHEIAIEYQRKAAQQPIAQRLRD